MALKESDRLNQRVLLERAWPLGTLRGKPASQDSQLASKWLVFDVGAVLRWEEASVFGIVMAGAVCSSELELTNWLCRVCC